MINFQPGPPAGNANQTEDAKARKSSFEEVKPTKLFGIKAFKCQKQAAHIENLASQAICEDDVGMSCYRFLQSRKALAVVTMEFVMYSALSLLSVRWRSFPLGALSLPNAIVNLGNIRQYTRVYRKTETYLNARLPETSLNQIKGLSYRIIGKNNDLAKLYLLLKDKEIESEELRVRAYRNVSGPE